MDGLDATPMEDRPKAERWYIAKAQLGDETFAYNGHTWVYYDHPTNKFQQAPKGVIDRLMEAHGEQIRRLEGAKPVGRA